MHDADAAANRATRRLLTKDTEQETIIIKRSGGSVYPEEKSVQTSGATSKNGSRATIIYWMVV